jgi:solute carrier family 25 phosphate transporter 3
MADKLAAMKPQKKIELFSANYFAACTLGGIIACGPTHTMVTPLDLVSLLMSHYCQSYTSYTKRKTNI